MEYIMPINPADYDDETLAQAYEQATGKKLQRPQGAQVAGQQATTTQPQAKNAQDLINQLMQPTPKSLSGNVGDFLTRLGGGKPEDTSGSAFQKAYLGQYAKSMFDKPEYLATYDPETGNPIYHQTPGRIKNQPFYATQQGSQLYGEKSRQASAQADQAIAETGLMNQVFPAVQDAMAGNKGQLPPGASISAGPVTFQPNPRLTDTEQAAVAGSTAIEPVVERILSNVRGGIFGQGNDIERTARQGIVDSGNAMLSSRDERLQAFQSDMNNLKRLIPFTDGGKQLTPFEAKRVFALLNTTGKNDQQIEKDITAAVSIVMAKGGLALGGRNAAIGLQTGQQQSQVPGATPPNGQVNPQIEARKQALRAKYANR